MQQKLLQLEQIIAQSSAQSSAELQSSSNVNKDVGDEGTISAFHFLRIRPSYSSSHTISYRSPCFGLIYFSNDYASG